MLLRELLNEVSMAPRKLQQLALAIDAYCGIEFELYYPMNGIGQDGDEPDFDQDEMPTSIEHIIDFFESDYNGGVALDELRSKLTDELYEYADTVVANEWDDKKEDLISDYIMENIWDEDEQYETVYEELGYSEEEIAICEKERTVISSDNELYLTARSKVKDTLDEMVADAISEEYRNSSYNNALEEFRDDYDYGTINERDFLRYSGYNYMQDIYDNFNGHLTWPHMIFDNSDSLTDIASEFSYATGYDAVGCNTAHGCDNYKYKGEYFVFEPDSSLSNNDEEYSGIEIVSPKLSLSDMVDTLKTVIDWAKQHDCYTDNNCGLHMNVSIAGIDMDKVDYIKLALFLGDDYILQQFDRVGNTYARRALDFIQATITAEPEKGYVALDALQKGLNTIAGNSIQRSANTKYTSINIRDDRVEYRGAGNDWMNKGIDALVNALYRYVVALDISADPNKHRDEYSKKLYSFLNKSSNDIKISKAIADYLSHSITDEQMMGIIKSTVHDKSSSDTMISNLTAQLKAGKINKAQYQQALGMRQRTPEPTIEKPVAQPQEWVVIGPNNIQHSYKAASPIAAINMLRQEYKLNSVRYPNSMFTVSPSYQVDIFNTFGDTEQ